MPLGFRTGAGVIFGVSGGVSEAVLRYAVEKISGNPLENTVFKEVRGLEGIKEATYTIGNITVKLAVVHSLANARIIADKVKKGECDYDLIEVMACPGGCIGGAGQPCSFDKENIKEQRAKSLYEIDKNLELHKAQDNPYVKELYRSVLKDHHSAHEMLHTGYSNRKRMTDDGMPLSEDDGQGKLPVNVCLGTSCYLNGAQDLLHELIVYIDQNGLSNKVDVRGSFCFEKCSDGPVVRVGDEVIEHCTITKVIKTLEKRLVAVS
jgi:NADH-quinone oxidoreductase subunit G